MVGYTSPEIEALNGNADRSLTATEQTGAPVSTLPPFCLSAEFPGPESGGTAEAVPPLFAANLRV